MQHFTIGIPTQDELGSLPPIELSAAGLVSEADLPPHISCDTTPYGALRRARTQGRLWVARVEDTVVGFVICSFKDDLPYVREIDVLPSHGRRGIGTQLMKEATNWARRRRATYLTLTTFRHLPFNAPFYQRLGFEEIPLREQGEELRRQLIGEARRGLDPTLRIAMRLALG